MTSRVLLLVLVLGAALVGAVKAPKGTTKIGVNKPMAEQLMPGESMMFWYNARTDSDSLKFVLTYAENDFNATDFEMIARWTTDETQPIVAEANCTNGECLLEASGKITLTMIDEKDNETEEGEFKVGFPWILDVRLSNVSSLGSQWFTLAVYHNYTIQGIGKARNLLIILTSVFGGLAVIVCVYAALGILGVFHEERSALVSTRYK